MMNESSAVSSVFFCSIQVEYSLASHLVHYERIRGHQQMELLMEQGVGNCADEERMWILAASSCGHHILVYHSRYSNNHV